MKFFDEFKKFAFKGNVIDMAVGVIVGGAFGTIVTSLVNDIMMPLIGLLTGGINFSDLKIVLREAVMEGDTVVSPENALLYGKFIQNILYFFIIAFSIFIMVRILNKSREKREAAKKKEEAPKPEEPKKPTQEELLTEIRDLLKAGVPGAEEASADAGKNASEKQ